MRYTKEVDSIGRILVIEFAESESHIFEEVAAVLKKYPTFESLRLADETVLSIPGFMVQLTAGKYTARGKRSSLPQKNMTSSVCLWKTGDVSLHTARYTGTCGAGKPLAARAILWAAISAGCGESCLWKIGMRRLSLNV